MRLFEFIDRAMLSQESREAYYSKTPRVWPSEASAVLFDQRESKIIGGCHRKSFFRLTGEPLSNQIDVVGARRFRTGRAMEFDIITLAKDAGIFVACGVRYHVAEIDLPLELDLVVRDPETGRLYIVENKTIYGYISGKKVIKEGNPKLEGVMQSIIYLNEFGNGAKLKAVIRSVWERKQEIFHKLRELQKVEKPTDAQVGYMRTLLREYDRNRIEVDFTNLDKASDGPTFVKMAYETRDDCQTREFDISLYKDEIDGTHYPEIDGIPQKLFTIESVYQRYQILQDYHRRAVAYGRKALESKGKPEPDESDYKASKAWWDELFDIVRAAGPELWPPAEYEWRYSADKIQILGEAGILGKTKYRDWQKKAKGKTHIGAWNCAYCPYKAKCISNEYPEMSHLVADLMSVESEEEAA